MNEKEKHKNDFELYEENQELKQNITRLKAEKQSILDRIAKLKKDGFALYDGNIIRSLDDLSKMRNDNGKS